MLAVSKWAETIEAAFNEQAPHKICQFIYELSDAFNKFYHECQINVEDETTKYTRTNVVKIARYIIKDALSLLGIQCPEQM